MKYYLVEPTTKRSVIEIEYFTAKSDDGVTKFLEKETVWRWGSFLIGVPDDEEVTLPNPEDDEIAITNEFGAEMLECEDGCSTTFYVRGDGLTEEECDDLALDAEEAYEEDSYEGLEDLGWEPHDVAFELHNGCTVVECDKDGDPLKP
jgi:hypothetical protein